MSYSDDYIPLRKLTRGARSAPATLGSVYAGLVAKHCGKPVGRPPSSRNGWRHAGLRLGGGGRVDV